jgi:hypothetical protein
MASFMRHCLDLNLVSEWLCGDDGSGEDDIGEMKRYGFNVFRSPQKGHSFNLNNLYPNIKTDFFFQCEDDWWFKKDGFYITDGLRIMSENQRIGQVLLCPQGDVHEGIENYTIEDGAPRVLKYQIVKYCVYGKGIHPAFSLNPGLNRTGAIREVGPFEIAPYFERMYGLRYASKYERACTAEDYVEHIGKQTAYENKEKI